MANPRFGVTVPEVDKKLFNVSVSNPQANFVQPVEQTSYTYALGASVGYLVCGTVGIVIGVAVGGPIGGVVGGIGGAYIGSIFGAGIEGAVQAADKQGFIVSLQTGSQLAASLDGMRAGSIIFSDTVLDFISDCLKSIEKDILSCLHSMSRHFGLYAASNKKAVECNDEIEMTPVNVNKQ